MNTTTSSQATLLIIDDAPSQVRLLRDFLTAQGFKVFSALNGTEGLLQIEQHHPDLILLDVMMPDGEGFKVCKTLKSQAQTRDIPIILLTTLSDDIDKVKGLELGAVDYISKPFVPKEVLARVNSHLSLRCQQPLVGQNQQLQQEIERREQMEEALQKNIDFIIKINDVTPHIIYVYDLLEQRLQYMNDSVHKVLGYSPQSCLDLGASQLTRLIHPDDWQLVVTSYEKILQAQEEESIPSECRVQHAQGEWRWLVGRIVIFNRTREGAPQQIMGMVQDITWYKQIDISLYYSEKRFELAMRGANDSVWDWDIQTNTIYFSLRCKQMLGIADDVFGLRYEDYEKHFHPAYLENVRLTQEAYLRKEIPLYEVVCRMRHQQGHYIWILSRATAIWNEQGQPVRLVGTYMDLTPLKQVEEKLGQRKELLRLVIDTVPQLIFWKTCHGVYLGCNQHFARAAGMNTSAQIVGRQDIDLPWQNTDQIAYFWKMEQQVMKNDTPSVVVELVKRADGRPSWWEVHRMPLHDATGTVIGLLGSREDITENKLFIENTLFIEKLQASEAYLQQAKEVAETANRAKSVFLTNTSHELRTPLNAILGFTQILKRDNTLTSQQQEGIAVIHRNGEYLLTLINDVLDLAKVEAGKLILYPSEFHLEEFLQSLVDLFRSRAEQTKIQFSYQPSGQLPSVIRADETRLRQVLINLLGNALKFTKQGGVILRVHSEEVIQQEEGSILHKLHFEIEDTGPGIAPANLDRIFLPFQQVNDPTGPRDGTGLGLPITKKLLNMMGCELQIKSMLGEGSLFWFDLQVLELFQTTLALRSLASPVILGFVGPPRKILIVDDSWENSLVLVNLLKVLGFELKTVNNGKDSIDLARDWQPDLVLMDLVMAGIDGFEATRRIKRLPRLAKLPVVAVSASAFEFHKQASFEAGCDNFISKPVHLEELLACLQKHLQLTWIYQQPAPATTTGLPPRSKTEESPSLSEERGLSKEQAAVLLDLGRRANLYGLIDFAKSLEQADEKWSALAKQIQQLAKSYQMDKICELAQKYV